MTRDPVCMMELDIRKAGVMGSAGSNSGQAVVRSARIPGKTIAEHGLILITGACPGLPYECALGAREYNALSVGRSQARSDQSIVTRLADENG